MTCARPTAFHPPDTRSIMGKDYDSSDILGSSVPLGPGRAATASIFSSSFNLSVLGAIGLVVFLALRNSRVFLLRWKERHYRL